MLRRRSPFHPADNDDNDDNDNPDEDDASLTLPASEVPLFYLRMTLFLVLALGSAWASLTVLLLLPAVVGQPILAAFAPSEALTDAAALCIALGALWAGYRVARALYSSKLTTHLRAVVPAVVWLTKVRAHRLLLRWH
jgi:hypothetical protein